MPSYKVGVVSLGCPKNQVDCEILMHKLVDAGFKICTDVENTDIILINTCGFIEDAKKEAIDRILFAVDLKQQGLTRAVVVTGCLAQRYKQEVMDEIPELDAVVGIGANEDIVSVCTRAVEGEGFSAFPPVNRLPLEGERILTTPEYTAFLRIADGCSNCCSYCAIPSIRGDFRSRSMESILAEAKSLCENDVKELVLVAQDTTRYGDDLPGRPTLSQLIKQLVQLDGVKWIRLLYCYPDGITDELLDVMREEDKVCKYIDLPLQHADASILKAMNRRGDKESLLELIEKIRAAVPGVVLRTTLITGFPGEGEKEFECLYDFVKRAEFDKLGCFTYSAEEGTPAALLPGQLDEQTKADRMDMIMRLQHDIVCRRNEERVGEVYEVVVEGYDGYSDSYYGRSYMDAAEIDAQIYFTSAVELFDGEFVNVKIINANEYDLIGKAVELL